MIRCDEMRCGLMRGNGLACLPAGTAPGVAPSLSPATPEVPVSRWSVRLRASGSDVGEFGHLPRRLRAVRTRGGRPPRIGAAPPAAGGVRAGGRLTYTNGASRWTRRRCCRPRRGTRPGTRGRGGPGRGGAGGRPRPSRAPASWSSATRVIGAVAAARTGANRTSPSATITASRGGRAPRVGVARCPPRRPGGEHGPVREPAGAAEPLASCRAGRAQQGQGPATRAGRRRRRTPLDGLDARTAPRLRTRRRQPTPRPARPVASEPWPRRASGGRSRCRPRSPEYCGPG